MTISDRIFERLQQLSISQKEFARKAGIQQSTISEWKKNKTNPSSDKILAICKALDVRNPGVVAVRCGPRGEQREESGLLYCRYSFGNGEADYRVQCPGQWRKGQNPWVCRSLLYLEEEILEERRLPYI